MVTQLPHQGRLSETRETGPSVSLLDHVTKLLHEMELRHEQRCERIHALDRLTDARITTLRTLIDSQAESVTLALASADKAVTKAERATERRFDSVNEFRETLSDQTKSFISRAEFEALRDVSSTRITDLSSRLDRTEGKAVGLNAGWIYLLGGLAAACALASLAVAIFLRTT